MAALYQTETSIWRKQRNSRSSLQKIWQNLWKQIMQTIAPWGDVVMFYKEPGSYNGLYELGQVISGGEYIESIPEGTYIFEK